MYKEGKLQTTFKTIQPIKIKCNYSIHLEFNFQNDYKWRIILLKKKRGDVLKISKEWDNL